MIALTQEIVAADALKDHKASIRRRAVAIIREHGPLTGPQIAHLMRENVRTVCDTISQAPRTFVRVQVRIETSGTIHSTRWTKSQVYRLAAGLEVA